MLEARRGAEAHSAVLRSVQDTKQFDLRELQDQIEVEVDENPVLHRIATEGYLVYLDQGKHNFRGEEGEERVDEDFRVFGAVEHGCYVGTMLTGLLDELGQWCVLTCILTQFEQMPQRTVLRNLGTCVQSAQHDL
ncbi:hypothetical protein D3C77_389360 [compost metagenome]